MATVLYPWQVLVAAMAGSITRQQDAAIDYLREITPSPAEPWMIQIGRNLTDPIDGALAEKRFLILDRDSKFSKALRNLLQDAGVKVVRLPYRSPNLKAYAERFVRSIKDECLNRMIFFGERSLRKATREYAAHYHQERNHQGIDNRLIEPDDRAESASSAIQCAAA
jgi:putative transposase